MASNKQYPSPEKQERERHSYSILLYMLPRIQLYLAMNPELPVPESVSERCFTYCTQDVQGRATKQTPWCRTICLRKVYKFEITGTMPDTRKEVDLNIPLPAEGQKGVQFMKKLLGGKHSKDSIYKDDGKTDWNAFTRSGSRDVEVWKPGWYLFLSKRLYPGVDELVHMDSSLWYKNQLRVHQENAVKKHDQETKEHKTGTQTESQSQSPPAPVNIDNIRAVLDTDGTILIPVPPPIPSLSESMSELFSPTAKILQMTRDSITSGGQLELAGRLWKKAQSKDPFILAGNVIDKAWKMLRNVDDDDEP